MKIRRALVYALLGTVGWGLAAAPVTGSPQAEVSIVRPEADQTLSGSEIRVELEVRGVVLGARNRNGAYALLVLDDHPPVKSLSRRFTLRGVDPGSHRLVVQLRRPDGSPFEPDASASVRFRTAPDGSLRADPTPGRAGETP